MEVDKIKKNITNAIGCVVLFIFSSIVMNHQVNGGNWLSLVLPIITIGFIMTLIPEAETWVYEPWQSRPEKYESGRQQ